jgi:ATP synthase protein I
MPEMARRDHPPQLKDLGERLKAARTRQDEARGGDGQARKVVAGSGLGFGLRIAVDLLAGLAIGVGLGLVLDNWLGTTPLMLVVFFFLGAAAGMLNVYRSATGRGYSVGYHKDGEQGDGAGEDIGGDKA